MDQSEMTGERKKPAARGRRHARPAETEPVDALNAGMEPMVEGAAGDDEAGTLEAVTLETVAAEGGPAGNGPQNAADADAPEDEPADGAALEAAAPDAGALEAETLEAETLEAEASAAPFGDPPDDASLSEVARLSGDASLPDDASLSDDAGLPDEEVPAADPAASEVEAALLEAQDAAARGRQLRAVIEALLFASEEPITVASLKKVVEDATTDELKDALRTLKEEYDAAERGVALFEVAGGFLICTRDTFAPWVEKMVKGKRRVRLSRAGLETIAVVAYKQPISRAEIERIRGVDCGGVLGTLVERDLVMIKGRDTGPGKPLLYGTTQEFLNYFGLNKISELPRLDELSTLAARNPSWSDAERARFTKHGVDEVQLELPGELSAAAQAVEDAEQAADTAPAESPAPAENSEPDGHPQEAESAEPAETVRLAEEAGAEEIPALSEERRAAVAYEAADGDADTDAGYGDGHEARPV